MSKTINFKMTKENEFKLDYECEGFEGTACESVEEIMNNIGTTYDRKATDDAHAYEIPIPAPIKTNE